MFTNWVLRLCCFPLSACQPMFIAEERHISLDSNIKAGEKQDKSLGTINNSKNIFISTTEFFFIFERGYTMSCSHSQMGDKWWDKFQIRSALFELHEQSFSRIPNNSHKSAAEAAARMLRPAFRIAVVNSHLWWSFSSHYFLKEMNLKDLLASLPYVRQTNEAV